MEGGRTTLSLTSSPTASRLPLPKRPNMRASDLCPNRHRRWGKRCPLSSALQARCGLNELVSRCRPPSVGGCEKANGYSTAMLPRGSLAAEGRRGSHSVAPAGDSHRLQDHLSGLTGSRARRCASSPSHNCRYSGVSGRSPHRRLVGHSVRVVAVSAGRAEVACRLPDMGDVTRGGCSRRTILTDPFLLSAKADRPCTHTARCWRATSIEP